MSLIHHTVDSVIYTFQQGLNSDHLWNCREYFISQWNVFNPTVTFIISHRTAPSNTLTLHFRLGLRTGCGILYRYFFISLICDQKGKINLDVLVVPNNSVSICFECGPRYRYNFPHKEFPAQNPIFLHAQLCYSLGASFMPSTFPLWVPRKVTSHTWVVLDGQVNPNHVWK